MNQAFWATLNVGLHAMQDFLALLAVLFVGRFFYRVTTKIKIEDQIVSGNVAMGVTKAGFLVGLALAATGGVWTVPDCQTKALMIGIIGIVSMVLLRLSILVNDYFVLSKFNNLREITENQNLGIAFVEAGGTVANGLIIAGAMSGQADSLLEKLEYGFFYWLVGQLILVVSCHLYHLICGFNVDEELAKKNTAPGISFGGFLVASGIVTGAAMYGVSTSFVEEMTTILVLVAIGLLLLVIGKLALSKVLLPKASMADEIGRDRNSGAAALSAVGFISLAILYSASISPATTAAALGGSEPPVAQEAVSIDEAVAAQDKQTDTSIRNNSGTVIVGDKNVVNEAPKPATAKEETK